MPNVFYRPRSTMDSIRVSEAPDPSSILGEATNVIKINNKFSKITYTL